MERNQNGHMSLQPGCYIKKPTSSSIGMSVMKTKKTKKDTSVHLRIPFPIIATMTSHNLSSLAEGTHTHADTHTQKPIKFHINPCKFKSRTNFLIVCAVARLIRSSFQAIHRGQRAPTKIKDGI